jgi:hypothetical protein
MGVTGSSYNVNFFIFYVSLPLEMGAGFKLALKFVVGGVGEATLSGVGDLYRSDGSDLSTYFIN